MPLSPAKRIVYDKNRTDDRRGEGAKERQRIKNNNRKRPNRRQKKGIIQQDYQNTKERHRTIVGVDGEGQDTPDGRHVYTYLCAVSETGRIMAETRFASEGLSHEECCKMLLKIGNRSLKFGYMFSYDVTKIIEEMPTSKRYYLLRPDLRKKRKCRACGHQFSFIAKKCPKCKSPLINAGIHPPHLIHKKRGYAYFNGSLTIAEGKTNTGWNKSVKINDCFRFFGTAFVEAIKAWDVCTKEEVEQIASMKGKRGAFDSESAIDIMSYCRKECHFLAKMMRKLIDAHRDAGIPLTQYFGAGSTATALLKKYQVDLYRGKSQCECGHIFTDIQRSCTECNQQKTVRIHNLKDLDNELQYAIMASYFGGRFENSGIGFVDSPIWSKDIASAYPYALTFMPCLRCGSWKKDEYASNELSGKIRTNSLRLYKFQVRKLTEKQRKNTPWMPLPFRTDEGSICYPSGFTGYGWEPEVLSALRGWPGYIRILDSWTYITDCSHQPFGFIPNTFKQRIAWGKEGKGLVLKLGMNASYGKAAQIRGGENPPFQSWIWAGMTTATTRCMLNDVISSAKDRWKVHAVATDGVYTSEELYSPIPIDTGTFGLVDPKGEKKEPLGGWETKIVQEGAFFIKPGLYWRQKTTIKDIRARGLGRREAFEQKGEIEQAFLKWNREEFFESQVVLKSRRFFGAKHSIYMVSRCICGQTYMGAPENPCPECGKPGIQSRTGELEDEKGNSVYGTWDIRLNNVAFDPWPKRERLCLESVNDNPRYSRLLIRDMNGAESQPYRFVTTPEGENSKAQQEFMLEQPDWEEREMEVEE